MRAPLNPARDCAGPPRRTPTAPHTPSEGRLRRSRASRQVAQAGEPGRDAPYACFHMPDPLISATRHVLSRHVDGNRAREGCHRLPRNPVGARHGGSSQAAVALRPVGAVEPKWHGFRTLGSVPRRTAHASRRPTLEGGPAAGQQHGLLVGGLVTDLRGAPQSATTPAVGPPRRWPAPGPRNTPGRRRRRRARDGSQPPDARSASFFSHSPVTPLYGKVLPRGSMHLTSCIHHSFRTAPSVPSARLGRLRRTH